jgi:hypothetical protein
MKPTISKTTPSILPSPGKLQRRAWGLMHMVLCHISKWYSWWYGISFDGRIIELPFGLILKWSDRTSKEEAAAMQMARAAGMPVPKVISCGEHPNEPYNHFWSILMTRLPGISLENSYDPPDVESEEPWLFELKSAWLPCANGCRLMLGKSVPATATLCAAHGYQII